MHVPADADGLDAGRRLEAARDRCLRSGGRCEIRAGYYSGLHVLGGVGGRPTACWTGCAKHNDQGGRIWSRIRRIMDGDDDRPSMIVGMLLCERRHLVASRHAILSSEPEAR